MISRLKKVITSYKNSFKALSDLLHGANFAYSRYSYSQEGEDLILARIFEGKSCGFYIDVGAHHPQRFSNTYYFYLQGWRGINIDAMPTSMNIFNKIRPNDINLEIAISDSEESLTYYIFNEPALNGFCKELAEIYINTYHYNLVDERNIQTYRLSDILDKHLPPNQEIDFISIDVEGLDYQVLNSNDWKKYRPRIVLVEALDLPSVDEANSSKIASLMHQQSYTLYCKTVNTLIFKRN